jgi:translation initiation factor 1
MAKEPPRSSPFASLAALATTLPQGPAPAVEPEAAPRPGPGPFSGKVVVARSKKGRGGKAVTTIAGVRMDPEALASLARELRTALGCGATVEGEEIVVQGEQQARVKTLLAARGARTIVLGN